VLLLTVCGYPVVAITSADPCPPLDNLLSDLPVLQRGRLIITPLIDSKAAHLHVDYRKRTLQPNFRLQLSVYRPLRVGAADGHYRGMALY